MVTSTLSVETQNYLTELVKRRVISESSMRDQMLINYLNNLKIDVDYFKINRAANFEE